MQTLLIALGAGVAFLIAYHTYGKWLGRKVFNLAADFVCPSHRLRDDVDYCPTKKPIVFGHHFTSIAGTGPIVGPAIAVMWGWVPALLWVVFGSIFIGAVHDFGALVVSIRNNGQSVGDIAGRVLNKRVRLLFLVVLVMALTIVLAIFGLVIAVVFKQYPAAIFPCVVQIPIALAIGLMLHRKGVNILVPSIIALAIMYATVIWGDVGILGTINAEMASWPIIVWVGILLLYSYFASVLPVWSLLQPRDYINSLQLISALALIVIGLAVAGTMGGAPNAAGGEKTQLSIVAPTFDFSPADAPLIFPFLFITIACGAISGFHCLVSSGTSSKQIEKETDARFVGYGSMLTEGFLATLVICACVAGLGMGAPLKLGSVSAADDQAAQVVTEAGGKLDGYRAVVFHNAQSQPRTLVATEAGYRLLEHGAPIEGKAVVLNKDDLTAGLTPWATEGQGTITDDSNALVIQYNSEASKLDDKFGALVVAKGAWATRYQSWKSAKGLGPKVAAFVDGSANFLRSLGIPLGVALALMGVLVASFAGTTLDTACRLQRYVIQELAATVSQGLSGGPNDKTDAPLVLAAASQTRMTGNPVTWLTNKHVATIVAIVIAAAIATLPAPGKDWDLTTAGGGGLILWPLFGATNQLLAGLSFLVITFYLWRRNKPIFFIVPAVLFMLVMPGWAMAYQLFIGSEDYPAWLGADQKNWAVIVIAGATLLLEVWMILEAIALWPRSKGVLEPQLPGADAPQPAAETGMNC